MPENETRLTKEQLERLQEYIKACIEHSIEHSRTKRPGDSFFSPESMWLQSCHDVLWEVLGPTIK